jgi:hypothetical protein
MHVLGSVNNPWVMEAQGGHNAAVRTYVIGWYMSKESLVADARVAGANTHALRNERSRNTVPSVWDPTVARGATSGSECFAHKCGLLCGNANGRWQICLFPIALLNYIRLHSGVVTVESHIS